MQILNDFGKANSVCKPFCLLSCRSQFQGSLLFYRWHLLTSFHCFFTQPLLPTCRRNSCAHIAINSVSARHCTRSYPDSIPQVIEAAPWLHLGVWRAEPRTPVPALKLRKSPSTWVANSLRNPCRNPLWKHCIPLVLCTNSCEMLTRCLHTYKTTSSAQAGTCRNRFD